MFYRSGINITGAVTGTVIGVASLIGVIIAIICCRRRQQFHGRVLTGQQGGVTVGKILGLCPITNLEVTDSVTLVDSPSVHPLVRSTIRVWFINSWLRSISCKVHMKC